MNLFDFVKPLIANECEIRHYPWQDKTNIDNPFEYECLYDGIVDLIPMYLLCNTIVKDCDIENNKIIIYTYEEA